MLKNNDLALIEKYFDEALSKEDLKNFEQSLTDVTFRQRVLLEARLLDSLIDIDSERVLNYLKA